MKNSDPPSERILEEAIGWMVAVREGFTDAEERRAFENWLGADLRHRQTWEKLGDRLAPIQSLEGKVSGIRLVEALSRDATDRRTAIARLGGGAALILGGLAVVEGSDILFGITSDYRTAVAQRRDFTLPDGTGLTLDARSRADHDFADGQRGLVLQEGNALLSVRPLETPFRTTVGPLVVETQGGELALSHGRGATQAVLLAGAASFTLSDMDRAASARPAGYEVRDDTLFHMSGENVADAKSWTKGLAILHDRTIGDLVEAIRPYHHGIVTASRTAANIRLSGVFDLADLDGTLSLVGALHSLKFVRVGSLFHYIDTA